MTQSRAFAWRALAWRPLSIAHWPNKVGTLSVANVLFEYCFMLMLSRAARMIITLGGDGRLPALVDEPARAGRTMGANNRPSIPVPVPELVWLRYGKPHTRTLIQVLRLALVAAAGPPRRSRFSQHYSEQRTTARARARDLSFCCCVVVQSARNSNRSIEQARRI